MRRRSDRPREEPVPGRGTDTQVRHAIALLGHLLAHGLIARLATEANPATASLGGGATPGATGGLRSKGLVAAFHAPGPGVPGASPGPWQPHVATPFAGHGWLVGLRADALQEAARVRHAQMRARAILGERARPNQERHPARKRLMEVVQEQPGLNIQELAARLQLSRGATRYHLRHLIRTRSIATNRQGHHLLHFVSAMPPIQRKAVSMLRVRCMRLLVEALVEEPDARVWRLAARLDVSARSIRRSVRHLLQSGLAREGPPASDGRRIVLHPDTRLAWVLWCRGATPDPVDATNGARPALAWTAETLLLFLLSHWLG